MQHWRKRLCTKEQADQYQSGFEKCKVGIFECSSLFFQFCFHHIKSMFRNDDETVLLLEKEEEEVNYGKMKKTG